MRLESVLGAGQLGIGGFYSATTALVDRVRLNKALPTDLHDIELLGSFQSRIDSIAEGTVTMTVPPAAQAGDMLVMVIMRRAALTLPAGWTLVGAQQVADAPATEQWTEIYTKFAGPDDAGGTFDVASAPGARINATLLVLRAIDGAQLQVHGSATALLPYHPVMGTPPPSLVAAADGSVAVLAASCIHQTASNTSTYFEVVGGGVQQFGIRAGSNNRCCVGIKRLRAGDDVSTGTLFNTTSAVAAQDLAEVAVVIGKASAVVSQLVTEAGGRLVTEGGDPLVTE